MIKTENKRQRCRLFWVWTFKLGLVSETNIDGVSVGRGLAPAERKQTFIDHKSSVNGRDIFASKYAPALRKNKIGYLPDNPQFDVCRQSERTEAI